MLAVDVRERIPAICIAYHSSQECRHGYGGRFYIASESSSNLLSHFTQRPSTLPPLLQPIAADKPLLRWQHNVTTASRHHLRAPQINELRRVRSAADEIVHQRRPQVSSGSPCSQPRRAATMRATVRDPATHPAERYLPIFSLVPWRASDAPGRCRSGGDGSARSLSSCDTPQ